MKKTFIVLILLMIICVCVGCSGVKIKNDTFYTEYSYSDEAKDFVETGVKLAFNHNFKGFEISLNNGISFMGETKESLSGYSLSLSDDVLTSLSGLDELAASNPEGYKELVNLIKANVTANEQIYFSGDYMFSHTSIAMIKSTADSGDLKNLDGTYDYEPSDAIKFRLKNGFVYRIDIKTENNKTTETEQEKPVLRYTIQNRIVKMIRLDENGNDVYIENQLQATSYFYGTITYPDNFAEQFKGNNPIEYEKAKLLAGKTLAVLTTAYYKA